MFSRKSSISTRKEPALSTGLEIASATSGICSTGSKAARCFTPAMVVASILGHAAVLCFLSVGYVPVSAPSNSANAVPLKATLWFSPSPDVVKIPDVSPQKRQQEVAMRSPHQIATEKAVTNFESLVKQVKVAGVVSVAATNEDLAEMMNQRSQESHVETFTEAPSQDVGQDYLVEPQPTIQPADMPQAAQDEPKDDGELSFEPLLMYQLKIASTLQSNLRMRQELEGTRCLLQLSLSRDGMVLSRRHVGGSDLLCKEALLSVERSGNLPMPADTSLYAHLKDLQIEVVAPKR